MKKKEYEIAAFILLTSCIAMPIGGNEACADVGANINIPQPVIDVTLPEPSVSFTEPAILRYAGPMGPYVPGQDITPVIMEPAILRYAGPMGPYVPGPDININIVEPSIVRYAGPPNPSIITPGIIEPSVSIQEPSIVRYAGPINPVINPDIMQNSTETAANIKNVDKEVIKAVGSEVLTKQGVPATNIHLDSINFNQNNISNYRVLQSGNAVLIIKN